MKRCAAVIFCFIFLLLKSADAQTNDSCGLRISLLTCSPGEELYSIFGHSALRITDSVHGTDIIYNWGTFDFNEPGFYIKFMRGKLQYFVSPDKVQDFAAEYIYEGRTVTEQVLDLSCEDKSKISKAVNINMQNDNRFYKYDFLIDNCTTRLRDLIEKNVSGLKLKNNIIPEGTTFRNMIHGYLDKGSQPWSKLGIDVLLGVRIDKPATNDQAMFLPEYLMKAIDSFNVAQQPIVKSKKLIVTALPKEQMKGFYEPVITIGLICIVLFMLSFIKASWAKKLTGFTDTFLLYATGIVGLLILFMWFFTDHSGCADNYNIAWALPTNFIAAFFAWKNPEWIKRYFKFAAGITALLLISWFWLPQQMNIAMLPLTLLMFYRYVKLSKPVVYAD